MGGSSSISGSRALGFLAGLDIWTSRLGDPDRERLNAEDERYGPLSGPQTTQSVNPTENDNSGDAFPLFSALLPELKPLILAHCDLRTLVALLTVSRTISAFAHDLLYQKVLFFLREELVARWARILSHEKRSWDLHVVNGAERIAQQIFALQNLEGTATNLPSPQLMALNNAYRHCWTLARRSLTLFQRQSAGFGADLQAARIVRDETLNWLKQRIGPKKWIEEEPGREEWADPEPPAKERDASAPAALQLSPIT
jgi:hypothetical protein